MAYVLKKRHSSARNNVTYLPLEVVIPATGEKALLDLYKDNDFDQVYSLLKHVIEEGQTYPQQDMDADHCKEYYLSHDTFVLRHGDSVIGSFYVKPNFPGRSSHICNAGFIVNKEHRHKGIGELLFKLYLRIAKDLGYEGSFFNLVYASNTGSLKICRRLGFTEVGIIPKAGKLKGLGYVDAVQFYYDLTTLNENGEPSWGWPS